MKVGIYSGVFDPVHDGHLAFAREVIAKGIVDEVYFLVESEPRRKTNVTDAKHRHAMIEKAVENDAKINHHVIDQPTFSVSKTLPLLERKFKGAQIYLLMGSDLFEFVETWPDYQKLRQKVSFIVAKRANDKVDKAKLGPNDVLIDSPLPRTASSQIRSGDYTNCPMTVRLYIRQNKLY